MSLPPLSSLDLFILSHSVSLVYHSITTIPCHYLFVHLSDTILLSLRHSLNRSRHSLNTAIYTDYWNTISRLHPLPILPQYPSFDPPHSRFPPLAPNPPSRPIFLPPYQAAACPARALHPQISIPHTSHTSPTSLHPDTSPESPQNPLGLRESRPNPLPIFILPTPNELPPPSELANNNPVGLRMATPPGSPPTGQRPIIHLPGQSHPPRTESPPSDLGRSSVINRPMMSQRARQTSSEAGLRSHYRAYLDSSERTSPGEGPLHPGSVSSGGSNILPRGNYRRQLDNPFSSTREDGERMEYMGLPSDMHRMPPSWGEHRNAENRPLHPPGGSASSGLENQPPQPNPLINPFVTTQRNAPTFYGPSFRNQPEFSRGRLGAAEYHPSGRTLPDYQQLPAAYGVSYGPPPMPGAHRRQQNSSAPTPPIAYPPGMPSIRRSIDGHRRSGARGESENSVLMRPRDYSDEMVGARLSYPYVMTGALSRDTYYELHGRDSASETDSEPTLTFDTQSRPPPMEPEQMMLDMSCSICKEHTIDTVVLPCGHAVMCSWCAELQVPCRKRDKSTPRDRSAKCPMCRSKIKQKVCSMTLAFQQLTLVVQNIPLVRPDGADRGDRKDDTRLLTRHGAGEMRGTTGSD